MNYKIEAINFLLNEDCVLARYYPLIPFKEQLIVLAKEKGLKTKDDCLQSDFSAVLQRDSLVALFKRFLVMYDNESKLKLLNKLSLDEERLRAYQELFLLPGVKETRAELYYISGYTDLVAIADSSMEEILGKMDQTIKEYQLDVKLPLAKEVKTHIAVAKAFTL